MVILSNFAKNYDMKVLMADELAELYIKGECRAYKDVARSPELMKGFLRAVNSMIMARNTEDLKSLSFLHYEKLKHQLSGLSSVRLSNRFVHRLIFTGTEEGITVKLIEIDKTHYGSN